MVAPDLLMSLPRVTSSGPIAATINRIRDAFLSLTLQQTPGIRASVTPRGTKLDLPPFSPTEGTGDPGFQAFAIINDQPHIVAPWHLGFEIGRAHV